MTIKEFDDQIALHEKEKERLFSEHKKRYKP